MSNKLSNISSIDDQINEIREDFPILNRQVNGKQIIYFDNAATTQKPKSVVDALSNYYLNHNANVHRGIHLLSEEASLMFENAHSTVSNFLNAKYEEVIFTNNTTDSLNTVAYGLEKYIQPNDEIVLTRKEHHSNLVPFQQLAKRQNAKIRFIEITEDGMIDLASAAEIINSKTKIIAFPHMSNVLGSIAPVDELSKLGRENDSMIILDGAQSVPHMTMDMQNIDVDFMAFSGHKMLAPMGIGGLYGKEEMLEKLDPMKFGGDMISTVSYEDAKWNKLPYKFEAGTPNVGGAIALAAAIDYLNSIGMNNVRKIEHYLTNYALEKLKELDFVKIYGPDIDNRGGVI